MSTALTVDAIRDCLEGSVPSTVATCAADGTPNVTYTSQVDYVDAQHVALSFQFFNKTRDNIQANPRATVIVAHPQTAACYRLDLRYLRTEAQGRLFERMKAKLAGIASHTGMAGVFKLRGADIYQVLGITAVEGPMLAVAGPRRNLLAALRLAGERLVDCADLDCLLETTLAVLVDCFEVRHARLLLSDAGGRTLFTVGSRGYPESGVGSEIAVGEGVIGVAAEQKTAIRIAHFSEDYTYHRAMRDSAREAGLADACVREIPFAGLARPHSQLAVPILSRGRLAGVICVESPEERRFGYDDEDALVALAAQIGSQMALLADLSDEAAAEGEGPVARPSRGRPLEVRHYAEDHSIFLDQDYLIKGVAGAILWRLLDEYLQRGRSEFSNRELRLDPGLSLPEVADNLEARLILLARRLAERSDDLALEKTGRGRFRLLVHKPVELHHIPRPGQGRHLGKI